MRVMKIGRDSESEMSEMMALVVPVKTVSAVLIDPMR